MRTRTTLVTCAIMLLISLGLASCSGDAGGTADEVGLPDQTTVSSVGPIDGDTAQVTITLDELARFDGKDGRPAYVAVDGVVYDVSDSSVWPDGNHSPCNLGAMAGRDLSRTIEQAPARMRSLIQSMPVVGRLE